MGFDQANVKWNDSNIKTEFSYDSVVTKTSIKHAVVIKKIPLENVSLLKAFEFINSTVTK